MASSRRGRIPLEEDQKEGTRALTQSFIVGRKRASLIMRIQRHYDHSSRSVTIRKLIDDEAIRLGFAVKENDTEQAVVLTERKKKPEGQKRSVGRPRKENRPN